MDKIEMMAKIHAKRILLDEQTRNEQQKKNDEVARYAKAIHDLQPRISDLIDIATELLHNRLPLGKRIKNICGGYDDEFETDGCHHQLGFFFEWENGKRFFKGIGIEGGGCCGNDLLVDKFGTIIKNPVETAFARWTYENAYYDYCKKCKQFLDRFDDFEERVYNYVNNLTTNE